MSPPPHPLYTEKHTAPADRGNASVPLEAIHARSEPRSGVRADSHHTHPVLPLGSAQTGGIPGGLDQTRCLLTGGHPRKGREQRKGNHRSSNRPKALRTPCESIGLLERNGRSSHKPKQVFHTGFPPYHRHCAKRNRVGAVGGLVCASSRCDPPSPARGALGPAVPLVQREPTPPLLWTGFEASTNRRSIPSDRCAEERFIAHVVRSSP